MTPEDIKNNTHALLYQLEGPLLYQNPHPSSSSGHPDGIIFPDVTMFDFADQAERLIDYLDNKDELPTRANPDSISGAIVSVTAFVLGRQLAPAEISHHTEVTHGTMNHYEEPLRKSIYEDIVTCDPDSITHPALRPIAEDIVVANLKAFHPCRSVSPPPELRTHGRELKNRAR